MQIVIGVFFYQVASMLWHVVSYVPRTRMRGLKSMWLTLRTFSPLLCPLCSYRIVQNSVGSDREIQFGGWEWDSLVDRFPVGFSALTFHTCVRILSRLAQWQQCLILLLAQPHRLVIASHIIPRYLILLHCPPTHGIQAKRSITAHSPHRWCKREASLFAV